MKSEIRLPYAITGDLNTKDEILCHNHTETHEYFQRFIKKNHMEVLNTGEPTRNSNALDVTMSDHIFFDNTIIWETIHDLPSDHLACMIRTSFRASTKRSKRHHNVITINDWPESLKSLTTNLRQYPDANQHSIDLATFNELAVNSICKRSIRDDYKPFWTDELTKARNERTRSRKQLILARSKMK